MSRHLIRKYALKKPVRKRQGGILSFKDGSFSLIPGGISEGRLCHNTSQLCQVTARNLTFHSLVSGRYWLKTTPGKVGSIVLSVDVQERAAGEKQLKQKHTA